MTSEITQVIRRELERACSQFSTRVEPLGFRRTKKMLWTRVSGPTCHAIALARVGSSYGAPSNYSVQIAVQFAIRVLESTFPGLAINGPVSDATRSAEGRYHLRFNAQTGSTFERCVDDLVRFVVDVGEPWFCRFTDATSLLEPSESPLSQNDRELLAGALARGASRVNDVVSRKLLGLK